MSAVPTPDPARDADRVAKAAQSALRDAKGDLTKAVARLEQIVRLDRILRDELTAPLVRNACYDAVRKQIRQTRNVVWEHPAARQGGAAASGRVHQLASGTLLMFPLPGGKRLGDANRAEISRAAEFYAAQSADMAHKATWLRLVAQSMPSNTTKARRVLSEKRLRELQEAARYG